LICYRESIGVLGMEVITDVRSSIPFTQGEYVAHSEMFLLFSWIYYEKYHTEYHTAYMVPYDPEL
jgi:hypothetical protein